MSIHDRDLLTGKTKLETSIERIRTFCTGKKTLVAFSGGKDSQCCYHLAKMAGVPFAAQYSVTRFEPPELMQFIRQYYPDVTFRRAYSMSLVREIEECGLPNMWYRWCCNAKHKKTDGYDIAVIGIRFEESARRRSKWRMFGQKQDRTYYVCPICDWSEEDVWEFLNSNGIPHCSLYDEGYKRIGCVCCPLSPSKMRSDAARWPKMARMLFTGHLLNWKKVVDNKGRTKRGKFYRILEHGSAEAAFDCWLDHAQIIPVGHVTHDEPCLFAGTGFSESDDVKED